MDEAGARARINSMTRPPDVKEIEKNIETIRAEKEAAIKAQDFEKAAALRDSEKQTNDKLEQILNEWRGKRAEREGGCPRADTPHILLERSRGPPNLPRDKRKPTNPHKSGAVGQ